MSESVRGKTRTDRGQTAPDDVPIPQPILPWADDPLFRPIDADDFRVNGISARDFRNLRENGLVRVEFTLPPNMRLIDPATNAPSAETTVDI